ncbi:MAG TPA: hypothetical protein VK824_05920, partial [Planctomycetota bacterium]|nr:hypothetical protein [Planctomycetota bacterium]
ASGTWGYLFDSGAFVTRQFLLDFVAAGLATFTFTCVPPGMGERLGLDRDEDGLPDAQELAIGTSPTDPDSDGDGYLDGAETALGGHPALPDPLLPDAAAPVVSEARAQELFADIATLSCRTDEPATIAVDLGTQAGLYTLPGVDGPPGARRLHDVVLPGLPAGRTLHFRVRATDRNGNVGTAEGSFTTLPTMLHVADITLAKAAAPGAPGARATDGAANDGGAGRPAGEGAGGAALVLTARVKVVDHAHGVQAGIPVRGFWAGDLGGQPWEAQALTDEQGWATFTLAPFTPAAPGSVTFSPAYIGTPFPNKPWFVGIGGTTPAFFYDQSANAAHFRTLAVP